MNNNAWHQHCVLRDDVRQGTLELTEFAADLYAVRTGDAPNVYRVPELFFARTYPTNNLKQLVRDVLHRLSGRGGTPVINVQVAYGGGKTHALIALLHLAEHGTELQTHPTVQEFIGFSGLDTLPQARVALLPFDKFDVKNGLSVVSPDGKQQQVKTPWGALAYQLAGDEGLAKVATHEAGYITPAQPLLAELLKVPQAEGLSTLILLDEALMYMRGTVNEDPNRLGTFRDFFQGLTQAVASVEHSAIVASLISSDTVAHDPIAAQVLSTIGNIFQRLQESVEPVSEEGISELFRRRLFEHVPPEKTRRAVVDNLIASRQKLPLQDRHKDPEASDELVKAYPFHPELIKVFYQKWTQLSQFQRTRGVLRTFVIALREADETDPSELVGPTTLLGTDTQLSGAIEELIGACEEGNEWTPILRGELEKARTLHKELPFLKAREIEAAVIATFLHSQPTKQKAELTDLHLLLANADIDPASIEEGLSEWRKASWFLKEDESGWALGATPNLTRMHVRAMERLTEAQIDEDLVKRIRNANLGQNTEKVAVHTLPQSPADIPDTPELHFVIAEPEYAAVPGEEVAPALKAFFERTYPNSVILLAPESSRLAGLRQRIRKILGWQSIESGDDMNLLSEPQKALLLQRKQEEATGMLDSVTATYSALIAAEENGNIKTHLLLPDTKDPFERVKTFLVEEERVLTTALDPSLLTPGSYFDVWGKNETTKSVQGLYHMFASLPRLPRLLNRQVFVDTLRHAVTEGQIVLRTKRPDGSQYTYWREAPAAEEEFWKKGVELLPIEHAELYNLNSELFNPGQLPALWQDSNSPTTVGAIREFFNGADVPKLVSDTILFQAIHSAVQTGLLMARRQDKAYLEEVMPDAELTDDLELLTPLQPINGSALSHNALPEAWEEETSSVGKLMAALAAHKGTLIPWSLIVKAVTDALSKNLFETTKESPAWPCTADKADKVGLKVSQAPVTIAPKDLIGNDVESAWETRKSTLGLIKQTLESKRGISIPDDVFRHAVEQASKTGIIILTVRQSTDDFYQTDVRQPAWLSHAESHLNETEIQDLAQTVIDLAEIAPDLDFKFRITITAEGEPPSNEMLKQINEVLQKITAQLKFD